MSRIESIIDLIDTIIASNFTVSKIKKWGLCSLEQRDEQSLPIKYIGAGDCEDVSFDDKYALVYYHRITSEDESPDSTQGFGNNIQNTQTFNIRLVVFSDMKNLKGDGTDLTNALKDDIASLIPTQLTSAQLTVLEAQSCFISVSSKDSDKRRVFAEEMQGAEYNIAPNQILFAINYTVRLVFQEPCRSTTTMCDEGVPLPVEESENTNSTFCEIVLNCLRDNEDFCELVDECIGFTPENIANKSTNIITDQASNTKYPSVKSVYDWVVSTFQTLANLSTDLTPSSTKYPSVNAVNAGLALKKDTFTLLFPGVAITNPTDATTYNIGQGTLILTDPTAVDINIGFACTVIGAIITVSGNTTSGSTESSTARIRNTTQSTTTDMGLFLTNASTTNVVATTLTGLSIPIAAGDSFCFQWLTPTWLTNPVTTTIRVTLIFERA